MKVIRASSPCKLIISGEHAVVYSNPALAIAIKPHCTATLRIKKGKPGFIIRCPEAYNLKNISAYFELDPELKWKKGKPRRWLAVIELLKYFKQRYGFAVDKQFELFFTFPSIKGIGASAGIAACTAKVLFNYMKIKPPGTGEKNELFQAVQVFENQMHGKASGIDAATVLWKAVRAEKKKGKMTFTKLKEISLPAGCCFIVIDTKRNKPRKGTKEMVKIVSKRLANNKEMLQTFLLVFKEIVKQLKKRGNAQRLGALFNINHSLLATLGTSTEGIELARQMAIENGAYGAKITGAGGEGGAVVALASASKAAVIIRKLKTNKFNAFRAQVAL